MFTMEMETMNWKTVSLSTTKTPPTLNTQGDDHNNSKASSSGTTSEEPTENYSKEVLAKVGCLVALSLIIVLGNILVIASVVMIKTMHRVTNYLLVSLAIADLMVGLFTIPLFILWLTKHDVFVHDRLCDFILLSCLFITIASQANVITVTVERYTAVCYPFQHRRILASKPEVVSLTITLVWVFSAVSTCLSSFAINRDKEMCSYYSYFNKTFLLVSVTAGVFIPFAIIFGLNIKMLVTVHFSNLFTQDMYQPANSRRGSFIGGFSKTTKMVITLCCLFLLAWTPFFIVIVIHTFCSSCNLLQALDIILIVAFTNSAWNPVIYGLCNLTFRRAYKQILTLSCFGWIRSELPRRDSVIPLSGRSSLDHRKSVVTK